jgi:hypothetical protein
MPRLNENKSCMSVDKILPCAWRKSHEISSKFEAAQSWCARRESALKRERNSHRHWTGLECLSEIHLTVACIYNRCCWLLWVTVDMHIKTKAVDENVHEWFTDENACRKNSHLSHFTNLPRDVRSPLTTTRNLELYESWMQQKLHAPWIKHVDHTFLVWAQIYFI